jgi:hypothetical protein
MAIVIGESSDRVVTQYEQAIAGIEIGKSQRDITGRFYGRISYH